MCGLPPASAKRFNEHSSVLNGDSVPVGGSRPPPPFPHLLRPSSPYRSSLISPNGPTLRTLDRSNDIRSSQYAHCICSPLCRMSSVTFTACIAFRYISPIMDLIIRGHCAADDGYEP